MVTAIGVCGSLVLLGTMLSNKIDAFELSSDHTLRRFGMIFHNDLIFNFDCTRIDKDNCLALSHFESVSVHRLRVNLQLEPLERIDLMNCWKLLFRGDKLLVAAQNEGTDAHSIISYRVSGSGFSKQRLLSTRKPVFTCSSGVFPETDSSCGITTRTWADLMSRQREQTSCKSDWKTINWFEATKLTVILKLKVYIWCFRLFIFNLVISRTTNF